MTRVHLTLNGTGQTADVDPSTPLLHVLRSEFSLFGARFGCGVGLCGSCFVQINGSVAPACDTPMWAVEGGTVVTVEGLADSEGLHRVQQEVLAGQAAQCGYCVSGILISAATLLEQNANPDEPAVIAALERNLCRCGVQRRMVRAVMRAGQSRGDRMTTTGQSRGDRMTTTTGEARPLPKDLLPNSILSRWITVFRDGQIGLRVGKVELGQGILTALAQLAADELDVELAQVQMLAANTTSGPDEGLTSGSMSISDSGPAVRLVAANVRDRFRRAAAQHWRVDVEQISIVMGRIAGPEGNLSSYAELAETIDLDVRVDPTVPLKSLEQARLAGASVARLDLPEKVTGRPRFIHDLRLPGQLFGRVIRPPSPGAVLLSFIDPGLPGLQVVRDGSFLAVVGPDEAGVSHASESVRTTSTWQERDSLPDEKDIDAYLRTGPHEIITVINETNTPPNATPPSSTPPGPRDHGPPTEGQTLTGTYSRPFIAHASMAPSCAVACWRDDGQLLVWSHSQGIHNLRTAIAAALDLNPASVTVEHAEGAGCYGHNAADDAAFDAVLIARAVPGRPVQVLWSRSDELAWAPFGSAMTADVTATLSEGRLTSWSYDVYSQGHTARPGYAGVPGLLAATTLACPASYPAAVDPPVAAGAGTTRNALPGYDLPRRRVVGHRRLTTAIRSSAIRALGAYLNVFAIESFMDEAALRAGMDPLDFRLAHLSDARGRAVLKAAAGAAGWGSVSPEGVGRGLGYARYKDRGAYCAVVAEVEAEHQVRVRRLVIAVDVGRVVTPDGVRNQIEGGATQATSWTTKEQVRFDRRRVTSTDWESYPILRFSEAPELEVLIVEPPGQPSVGAGEAAQGPTAAAIANAVASAVGVRVRDLPLTTEAVIAAIEAQ